MSADLLSAPMMHGHMPSSSPVVLQPDIESVGGESCMRWIFMFLKILTVIFMLVLTVLTLMETRRAYGMETLASRLKSAGWKLYVNMQSCPFCHMQQAYFGPKAFAQLDVVDCDRPENKEMCASSACHFASPCWHNSETGALMVGLQRDRARLWEAAETGK